MLELTLSVLAWLSVVGFHLFVYLSLKARKLWLLHDELPSPHYHHQHNHHHNHPYNTYRLLEENNDEQEDEEKVVVEHDNDYNLQELGQVETTTTTTTQQHQHTHTQPQQQQAAHLYVLPGDALDGDEPDLFFELLSQTGSEMISSCRTLESVAREQIDETDRLFSPTPSSSSSL